MSASELAEYIKQRFDKGEYLVPLIGKKVGDKYTFNFMPHTVISICPAGDLEDHCWIKKDE